MQKFWLQDDRRDRAYTYYKTINAAMLKETYGVQENQLELVVAIWEFNLADRDKYIGDVLYYGRITSFPKAERAMPELLDSNIELSECKVTISNVDSKYTKYLPGGDNYRTFIGNNVSIYIGLRDEQDSLTPVFSGVVSHEAGVTFGVKDVTFSFRDKLDSLNNKVPLETLTKEAFEYLPDENVGKLIPMAFGDFTQSWDFIPNGTYSYTLQEVQLNVINMSPKGAGAGIAGYYVGGGFFLFHTGGRAGKTYAPSHIGECLIKRGNNYLQTAFYEDPQIVGGHWAVYVSGVRGKTVDNADIIYPYEWDAGDTVIIKVRVPIGDYWDDILDNSPMEQAKEILIALGRMGEDDIDQSSFEFCKNSLYTRGKRQTPTGLNFQKISITITPDYISDQAYILPVNHYGKRLYIGSIDSDGVKQRLMLWFTSPAWIPIDPDPEETGYALPIYCEGSTAVTLGAFCNTIVTACFNFREPFINASFEMNGPNQATIIIENKVAGDAEYPQSMDSGYTVAVLVPGIDSGSNTVADPIVTRIWLGDSKQNVLDVTSGLLKCCLIDMFVNRDLKIAFSSMWPRDWPDTSQMSQINQYDIIEDSISVSSEPRIFMTTGQANYSWNAWLNSAGLTTKKRKNFNAESKTGRSISKEFDLPNLYKEKDAIDVLETYIRLSSASLVTIKMEVGWIHLLKDLGEFVTLNITLGSLNFQRVPCQIRRVSILPNVCGSELELVCFINFSYDGFNSPSGALNLSSHNQELIDA